MATENITAADRRRSEEDMELDRAFDALAHSYRRIVIDELDRDSPRDVSELAERVADRDGPDSVRNVKLELTHRHLPKLDDYGVVAYDSTASRCDLVPSSTVRSILSAVDDRV